MRSLNCHLCILIFPWKTMKQQKIAKHLIRIKFTVVNSASENIFFKMTLTDSKSRFDCSVPVSCYHPNHLRAWRTNKNLGERCYRLYSFHLQHIFFCYFNTLVPDSNSRVEKRKSA